MENIPRSSCNTQETTKSLTSVPKAARKVKMFTTDDVKKQVQMKNIFTDNALCMWF